MSPSAPLSAFGREDGVSADRKFLYNAQDPRQCDFKLRQRHGSAYQGNVLKLFLNPPSHALTTCPSFVARGVHTPLAPILVMFCSAVSCDAFSDSSSH